MGNNCCKTTTCLKEANITNSFEADPNNLPFATIYNTPLKNADKLILITEENNTDSNFSNKETTNTYNQEEDEDWFSVYGEDTNTLGPLSIDEAVLVEAFQSNK